MPLPLYLGKDANPIHQVTHCWPRLLVLIYGGLVVVLRGRKGVIFQLREHWIRCYPARASGTLAVGVKDLLSLHVAEVLFLPRRLRRLWSSRLDFLIST